MYTFCEGVISCCANKLRNVVSHWRHENIVDRYGYFLQQNNKRKRISNDDAPHIDLFRGQLMIPFHRYDNNIIKIFVQLRESGWLIVSGNGISHVVCDSGTYEYAHDKLVEPSVPDAIEIIHSMLKGTLVYDFMTKEVETANDEEREKIEKTMIHIKQIISHGKKIHGH